MTYRRCRRGVVLLISMIVLAILSAWAVSICSMSGVNVQLAENQRKANRARANAESGLDILRFWLGQVSMPSTTAADEKFSNLATFLQNNLTANITPHYDGSSLITISPVTLDSIAGQTFSAKIIADDPSDAKILQVDVTGTYRTITRTIRVNYDFGPSPYPIFDYGVATRGPLHLAGNIELGGVNVAVESSVYIESDVTEETLSIIGNSQIAGDCFFANPNPDVYLQGGQASIGGETGEEAIANHVHTAVDPVEFPPPNPDYFEHYVINTLDPSTYTTETTFENIRIPANTDPSFSGGVTLKGIVFVETPNVVTFTGNASITGIIVGDGDPNDNSETNRIIFLGTVDSLSVSELPDEFGELKTETGTFLMAAGFSVSFGGNFETINGVIAANGIEFFGDAGGIINGSVINYSDTTMNLTGNSDLFFNAATTEVPAGFETEIVLSYDSSSYSEVVL